MEAKDKRKKIRAKIKHGFLSDLLLGAQVTSADVHKNYIDYVTDLAEKLREILDKEGWIKCLKYEPKNFWEKQKGSEYCFVDGGVANIQMPSVEPLGIRVGTYFVKPGDTTSSREKFEFKIELVDELFAQQTAVYEDYFPDTAKLRDAARIMCEIAAAYLVAKEKPKLAGLFVHGPLVNPVAPYGLQDFPSFKADAYNKLSGQTNGGTLAETDRHFVALYRHVLEKLKELDVPVYGVIERAAGATPGPLTMAVLERLNKENKFKSSDLQKIKTDLINYRITDGILLGLVLEVGEYIDPFSLNKQGPENKWPDDWKFEIGKYPEALVTYIKVSEESMPVRVEALKNHKALIDGYDLILHTSRLLPKYAFPVGLDIVDKYAKVPGWMTKGVRNAHAGILLRKAIESGNPDALALAKRLLLTNPRDWLFRPKAE